MLPHRHQGPGRQGAAASNRVPTLFLLAYLAFWTAMAVSPVDRFAWFLENLLIFVTVAVLIGTYRRFRFSDLSYCLILLFLLLHTYGAHHTYSQAPFEWLNRLFGPDRNNFDRLVHLSFGVLLAYPFWELLRRAAGVSAGWAHLLGPAAILAAGAFYELLEMWVATMVAPEAGEVFLGTQGDPWDAQKDMALALYGAAAAGVVTALRPFLRAGA